MAGLCARLRKYPWMIVRPLNVVLSKIQLLTVTDVSTTRAVVIFKVKESFTTSVDAIKKTLFIDLIGQVAMLMVVCQLSHDVIGYDRLIHLLSR